MRSRDLADCCLKHKNTTSPVRWYGSCPPWSIFIFLRFYLFILERRKERRQGEKHPCARDTSMGERYIHGLPLACLLLGTWPTTQTCALTGNRTSNPSVHRLALNPLSHTSQGALGLFWPHWPQDYTRSLSPHQPGEPVDTETLPG